MRVHKSTERDHAPARKPEPPNPQRNTTRVHKSTELDHAPARKPEPPNPQRNTTREPPNPQTGTPCVCKNERGKSTGRFSTRRHKQHAKVYSPQESTAKDAFQLANAT